MLVVGFVYVITIFVKLVKEKRQELWRAPLEDYYASAPERVT